jgi:Ca2+-binding EF-hand superfamily protein
MFTRLDKDGDGKLTKDELPERARERMARLFDKIGKEEITKDEFLKLRARRGGDGKGLKGRRGRPGQRPEGGKGPRRGRGPEQPHLLRVLDTDNDKMLSKEELAKAADKFDELDKNKDGKLDGPELVGPPPEMGGPDGGPGEGPRRAPRGNPDRGRQFERLDKDADGKISSDEAPEKVKDRFEALDADKDGTVTLDEFKKGPAGQRARQNRPKPDDIE